MAPYKSKDDRRRVAREGMRKLRQSPYRIWLKGILTELRRKQKILKEKGCINEGSSVSDKSNEDT